ncbi:MAG: hypothetical protein JWN40_1902 [Phycisphaerales bacterium]|nr:hypothetical protein [Phycisphaerales bacterium]
MGCNGLALMEGLESRQLMSTVLTSGGLCLPPGRPSTPGQTQPPPPPPPTPTPPATVPKHRHHRAAAGAQPLVALVPLLLGNWSTDSLEVTVSQSRTGELFAKASFTGAIPFQGSAQLTYTSATGQFALFVVSPKLVVKFSGTLVTTNRETPEFQGLLQSYTRRGAFKGSFTLQKTELPVNLA